MAAITRDLSPADGIVAASRWRWPETLFWLGAVAVFFLFPTHLVLATQILIAGLFAVSLDLVVGYAGLVSLGHAAFFGVGAYTAGILAQQGWREPVSGLAAAAAMAALLGWLSALLVMRVKGLAFLMTTLGLALVLRELASRGAAFTGGDDGLQGIEMARLFGLFSFDFVGRTGFCYTLGTVFLLCLLVRRIVHSPFGLALRGIRENDRRMPAIGVPTQHRLRTAYVLAAALAGAAGGLLAQTTQFVSLDVLGFDRSAEVLIMLVLGGVGRLYGGLIGAAIFMIARDLLSSAHPEYWPFWLGLILVVTVLFARGGLLGGIDRLDRLLHKFLRRRRPVS
jgi:branched-chain amino acid transport system permease protein